LSTFAFMKVIELLKRHEDEKRVSFDVLTPLKGNGTQRMFSSLDKLMKLAPLYISISSRHSEYVYEPLPSGNYAHRRIRRRPSGIVIAAAIQQRYNCPVIPHIVCSGTTAEAIEYELLDLQFLGIENLLLLRGDKARDERSFSPTPGGHLHTTDLIKQVNRFNEGFFFDGKPNHHPGTPFHYGVATYPEKHDEAPDLHQDMVRLFEKQKLGADYAVTQMFFDNSKFFSFVNHARNMGITLPIIPGIKPIAKLSQITLVPKIFHCNMPEDLAREALKVRSDDEARQLGIEWSVNQCRELFANGYHNIHFYAMGGVESVCEICKQIL
jgi:methylenetetrahydrofolate reductase (NADPH)